MKLKLWTTVLALFGISAFAEENGKKILTEEQKTKLTETFGDAFVTKLLSTFDANADEELEPNAAALADMQAKLTLAEQARQKAEQEKAALEAQNGKEALEIFGRNPPQVNLVITDLMMPVMDGTTLLRHLRKMAPGIKTIILTGGLSQSELAQAMEEESCAFILKPFGATTLLETIRRVLGS